MKNKKIPSELAIGIILILAIIIGGAVWLGGRGIKQPNQVLNQEAKKEVPDNNEEIEEWQTYRNEKYGFEIKLPNNYNFEFIDRDIDAKKAEEGDLIFQVWSNKYVIDISKTKFNTIDEWFSNSMKENSIFRTDNTSSENIDISGIKGKKIVNFGMRDTVFVIIKNGYLYNIIYNGFASEEDIKNNKALIEEERAIFNKILSTFKFIN